MLVSKLLVAHENSYITSSLVTGQRGIFETQCILAEYGVITGAMG